MFIICSNSERDIWIREHRCFAVRLRSNGRALDVLLAAKSDVHRRVPDNLEQLGTGMLVEHSLTKRAIFFPFIAAILCSALAPRIASITMALTMKLLFRMAEGKSPKNETL